MSTKKSTRNSRKTKKQEQSQSDRMSVKVAYTDKPYHIIENQKLNIDTIKTINYKNYIIPYEYLRFLKKCYKINNTNFPYTNNPNLAYLFLQNYLVKNGDIYMKDNKNRKFNSLTYYHQPDSEDAYDDNIDDSRFAIDILYFHNVPEEIGKLKIIIQTFTEQRHSKEWKQKWFGNKLIFTTKHHIIKSGTVVIINGLTAYKLSVENKLKNEYKLPILKFSGSII